MTDVHAATAVAAPLVLGIEDDMGNDRGKPSSGCPYDFGQPAPYVPGRLRPDGNDGALPPGQHLLMVPPGYSRVLFMPLDAPLPDGVETLPELPNVDGRRAFAIPRGLDVSTAFVLPHGCHVAGAFERHVVPEPEDARY